MENTTLEKTNDSPLNFLFIDDNQLVRRNLEQSFKLEESNVNIRLCPNLGSANKRLQQEQFDMIWVDYLLSKNGQVNGADWIDEVADNYPSSLFVIYTSHGGDPAIVKKVNLLYEKHTNFELFIEEKGSHTKLIEFYKGFVAQFLGVPPAFYRLLKKLEQKIETSKNEQYFLEGQAYYEYQQELNQLRENIAEQLKRFDNELLRRHHEKLKANWYDLLKEYYPSSPDTSQIWNRVNYFQFFNQPELRPYLPRMGLSAFRAFNSILNLYRTSLEVSEEENEKRLGQKKIELEFFIHLLKTLPEGESFPAARLKRYLKLRKEDIEQNLNPSILYELADNKQHLFPRVVEDWQKNQSMQRIEKILSPSSSPSLTGQAQPQKLVQVLELVKERIEPNMTPVWQKIALGNYILGGMEVISYLPSTCTVIFCDLKVKKSLIKRLWDKYPNPCLDTISDKLPLDNFSALLESLVLGRRDGGPKNFSQMPLIIIGYSEFLHKIALVIERWSLGNYIAEDPYPCWQELSKNNCLYFWEIS